MRKHNLRTQAFRNGGFISKGKISRRQEESIKRWTQRIVYKIIDKVLKEEKPSEHLVADDNKDEFKNSEAIFNKASLESKVTRSSLLTKIVSLRTLRIHCKFVRNATILRLVENAKVQLNVVLQKIAAKRMEDLNLKYYCFCRYNPDDKQGTVKDGFVEV